VRSATSTKSAGSGAESAIDDVKCSNAIEKVWGRNAIMKWPIVNESDRLVFNSEVAQLADLGFIFLMTSLNGETVIAKCCAVCDLVPHPTRANVSVYQQSTKQDARLRAGRPGQGLDSSHEALGMLPQ
jgi:hypothetical protein